MKHRFKQVLSLALVLCMVFSLMCVNIYAADGTETTGDESSTASTEEETSSYEYSIVHLDNGRKYYSVTSIKTIIDNAAAAGFNYIELAVGNDGMRFLLNDMSLSFTVGDTEYSFTSDAVSSAIHAGNESYYNETTDELTESEMNEIIAYAESKGMGVIPLVNTPGHMDAILDAGEALTGETLSYNGSGRTIDVTNDLAVAFTQALLQKYITYFAGKGCTVFNMGADEYANDKYTSGSMGFGALQSAGQYNYYVEYVNEVAALIKDAGMTPMAFNDGIYFNNNTSSGTFDTDIMIAYWSSGWSGYTVASASTLSSMGFQLVNTHGDYYWIVGGSQCSASTAANFSYTTFQGSTISDPAGAMFCIWSDYPGALTDTQVASQTADVVAAFGATLPDTSSEDDTDTDTTTSTVTNGTVTVTATDGIVLAGVSATPVEDGDDSFSYETQSEGATAFAAYNIEILDANGNTYTSSATVTMPLPESITTVTGVYVSNDNDSYDACTNISIADGYVTFTAPHFSTVVLEGTAATVSDTDDGDEVEVTNEETITVSVGGTATVKVDDNYSGTYTTADESVATVSAAYGTTEGGTIYTEVTSVSAGDEVIISYTSGSTTYYLTLSNGSLSYTTTKSSATVWTVGDGYTLSSGGYYLYASSSYGSYSLSASQSNFTNWSIGSNGFYTSISGFMSSSNYYIYYSTNNSNRGWYLSTSNTNTVEKVTTEEDWEGTTLTFTGVSEGTTTVTIGDTIYTINVVEAAPTDANTDSSVTVEYWITNAQVTANNATSMTISSSAANTTTGVVLADTVPSTGTSTYGSMVYWMTVVLDEDNHQTGSTSDDETGDGTTIVALRYYGGAWQYQTTDGTWHYLLSTDQVVAYYLQKTDVTTEITTLTKDWGYTPGSSAYQSNGSTGQVALTVAVVYPDGTVSPAESSMYSTSTTIFNYWSNRDIGIIAPQNNSDYTISKITYTYGEREGTSESWGSSETLTWNTVTTDSGSTWYDETTAWDTSYGTEPMVNGSTSGIYYKDKNTAVLILIYLEPVEKETNLTVKWVDDNDNEALISSSQIVVSYDSTEEAITFLNGLKQTSAVQAGEITLDDDAYVTNSSGVNQTINKDITIIPNVASQYASGVYYYVGAEISEDGMTLTLHYNIDTTKLSPEYVVDFGLSVKVPLFELVENSDDVASVEITGGNATYDETTQVLTYTPASVLTSVDPVTVRVTFNDSTRVTKAIGFVPATTVYYEEGFATYGTGTSVTTGGDWSGTTNIDSYTGTQQAHIANDTENTYYNYNYDYAYDDDTTGSNGTNAYTTAQYDSLKFTFTGTGVDIFANCDENSGIVVIMVQNSEGTFEDLLTVDMANTGNYATTTVRDTAYNTPIASISDLTYGSHTVTIYLGTDSDSRSSGFVFDGFRVYGTINESSDSTTSAVYAADLEDNPSYYELRNNVLGTLVADYSSSTYASDITTGVAQVYANSSNSLGAVVVYDSNSSLLRSGTTAQDLLDDGPKNELYLDSGASVVFKITTNREVQIGLRSVTGAEVAYTISDGTSTSSYTTSSSVDMFYTLQSKGTSGSVTYTITVPSTSSGILSITDIKVSDSTGENIFGSLTADEVVAALTGETAEAETTADAALTVNLVDYTGSVLASTDLTDTGTVGNSAAFSATDILAAVSEALPDGYAIVDEDSVADQAVAYGDTGSVNVQIGKVATLTVTFQQYSGLFRKTTVATVTLTKVQTGSASRATFSSSEIKAAVPSGYKALLATSATVSYGSGATKTVTVY